MTECEQCGAAIREGEAVCANCGFRPRNRVECIPGVLPLDEYLWSQLETGYGDGTGVAKWLRELQDAGADRAGMIWESIDVWGHLDHQGTVYSGSLAAIPYLLSCAKMQPPGSAVRHKLLILLGAISADAGLSRSDWERSDWREAFIETSVRALRAAVPVVTESLLAGPDADTASELLAALAGVCGYPKLWNELARLSDPVQCPECGAVFDTKDDV